MNTLYNQQQNNEALSILNEATKITFDYSVNVWEKQVDMLKQNMARRVSDALSFQQWTSPEAAFGFQRQAGVEILSEWQKFGEECHKLTDEAGKNLSEVAQKGRAFAEQSFDDAAKRVTENLPVGKEVVFPDAARQTAKAMSDICQNNMDVAAQAMRAGMETMLSGQKVAGQAAQQAEQQAEASEDNGAKRKQKRR